MNEESWMPWVGSAPQTGALLRYITGGDAAGAGSTCCQFGIQGTVWKRATGGRSVAGVQGDFATASHEGAEREAELRLPWGQRAVLLIGVTSSRAMLIECVWAQGYEDLVARSVDEDPRGSYQCRWHTERVGNPIGLHGLGRQRMRGV
jgi:hypothetical protein